MKNILELARVVRSKNSGPYELVLDIMFKSRAVFEALRDSKLFTPQLIAEAYGIPVTDVRRIIWFEPANAVKVVLPRKIISGAPGDSDVYGAQQHAPLLGLAFDI